MKPEPPQWHSYDPADSPPEITFQPSSSLVVLLATTGAEVQQWSQRAAISLARELAQGGRRVFLADLALTHPSMHGMLGAENDEGVADAFLYGASLGRIGKQHQEGFVFAPAGTPLAHGERVLAHPRWSVLAKAFSEAGARFLLYLPQAEPGYEALVARADQIVVLASPGETAMPEAVAEAGDRVAAVLWPPHGPDLVRQKAGDGAPEAEVAPTELPTGTPDESAARRMGPRGAAAAAGPQLPPRLVILLLLLAFIVIVVILVALGIIHLPGLASAGEPDGAVVAAAIAAAPASTDASYSLTLGSYREAAVARLQAESLGRQRPDLLVVVAPVEVDGEVFHRLLVGETTDPDAQDLRIALSQTLSDEDPTSWIVRSTPLAFHLGRYGTLEDARSGATELEALGVPAYLLRDEGSDGADSFHVWAGAYADTTEASYLRRVLGVDEVHAPLERRRGRLPR